MASIGFVEAAQAPSKTLQIDTPTTTGQTLGGSDSLTTSAPGSITTPGVAVGLKDGTISDSNSLALDMGGDELRSNSRSHALIGQWQMSF
ncbi:hypothetical protein [Pseudomonas fildesensis]|uniref:Autotransporter domain-containing protein n=1 Tax=Pseudomonas fildesensis TaxID=1674920 RepID=A0A0J8IUZ8_9PSED|nr:hypothetical protein [Pseudomonas fildesensis]KMT55646.1 hypothetical protein ACR52_09775 [Pseudomonas fildesensis]